MCEKIDTIAYQHQIWTAANREFFDEPRIGSVQALADREAVLTTLSSGMNIADNRRFLWAM